MKYCQNCGRKISQNTIFCPYCGTKQVITDNKNHSHYWLWLIIGYVLPLILDDVHMFVWYITEGKAFDINEFTSLFELLTGLVQFIISIVIIIKLKKQHSCIKYVSIILLIISLLSIFYNYIIYFVY